MRTTISLLAALTVVVASTLVTTDGVLAQPTQPKRPPQTFTWKTLKVGAGGWLTGMDVSPDGSVKIVRTDTYGAYIWGSDQMWHQLITANSVPANDVGVGYGGGVYEIRIAPSQPRRIYMAFGGKIYFSKNYGTTWAETAFKPVEMEPNDPWRMNGTKMAVDPINPNVVVVGTDHNGVFMTSDGGNTWTSITAIPINVQDANSGSYPPSTGIAFDASSGKIGGVTRTIYASSYGHGVWVSYDAGTSWQQTSGGPTTIQHAVAADGTYWAVDNTSGNVWTYSHGNWNTVAGAGGGQHTIAIDPANHQHIIVGSQAGNISQSYDGGVTWNDYIPFTRVATDIPWLAWTNESYMSDGDMIFDPSTGRLMFSEGIGVWWTNDPPASTSSVVWTSQSIGIEQLVPNEVISPPGGVPIVASWDRPVFALENLATYPLTHGPDAQYAIEMGWSVDYASSNPNFIVALINWQHEKTSYSTDGGQTWHAFPNYPPLFQNGKLGGGIAAATPQNIVWVPNNQGEPYYTLDGGNTWNLISLPGGSGGDTGWGWAYYFKRQIVAADRVAIGTFYMYNYDTGLYRSTDGGQTWTNVHGVIDSEATYHTKMKAVPGQQYNLFFADGTIGSPFDHHPEGNPLMRSTDGGVTWTPVPGTSEILDFGFGAPFPGHTYPAIYIAGWLNGVFGVYRSDDNAQTWNFLGEFPLGSLDQISTLTGDANVPGRVYVGFSGSGYAYGDYQ